MNPKVAGLLYRLKYELVTDGWVITFVSPAPIKLGRSEFEASLESGWLTVEMLTPFPDEAGARRVVEPFLRAWEIAVLLDAGAGDFRFEFRAADVSARETSTWRPEGGVRVSQVGIEVVMARPAGRTTYPQPPTVFVADDLVQRMWARWRQYRDGREGLSSVANFCLTELESVGRSHGRQGRAGAARWMNVSEPVLRKLGYLAAHRGTALDARKAGARPYTSDERAWVEAAVTLLIRRAGEVAAGTSPPQLTMDSLPPLP